jgi:hypothetical protein
MFPTLDWLIPCVSLRGEKKTASAQTFKNLIINDLSNV